MAEKKLSNSTSVSLFILLCIVTFGIYEIVWFYRQWKYIKVKEHTDISPFWRAWFAIFFIDKLFAKILEYAKSAGYKKTYSSNWLASLYILMFFLGLVSFRINYTIGWVLSGVAIFSFLLLIPPLNSINYYYAKKEKNAVERSWKWWQIVLIIMCSLIWALLIMGLMLPPK